MNKIQQKDPDAWDEIEAAATNTGQHDVIDKEPTIEETPEIPTNEKAYPEGFSWEAKNLGPADVDTSWLIEGTNYQIRVESLDKYGAVIPDADTFSVSFVDHQDDGTSTTITATATRESICNLALTNLVKNRSTAADAKINPTTPKKPGKEHKTT